MADDNNTGRGDGGRPDRPADGGQAFIARGIFHAARRADRPTLTRRDFLDALENAGIEFDDPRVADTVRAFRRRADFDAVDEERFAKEILSPNNATLIYRALNGELAIPDFPRFKTKLFEMFDEVGQYSTGAVADYIPQLARVDPDMYAMSVCTIDGQRASEGDYNEYYCVQSTCKPINYSIALELMGEQYVHEHVGREPSGQSFNELTLNKQNLPHNPMINAGAIMSCSMIRPELPVAERFDYVMSVWQALAGGQRAGFDNAVYHSERVTADRNFALGYFMRENGAFPENADMLEALDFYFQCCSITVTARQMALIAATFANGGVCPLTDERVFQSETVKNCLSLMYSCGMYDFSGEYAFTVGLPAKSGVSGALFIVIPSVAGIALWSPRLDALGNTVRGVEFSKRLVSAFPFHTYQGLVGDSHLDDPRRTRIQLEANESVYLIWAAASGDVNEVRRLVASGIDVDKSDYDGRTPLHLAAAEGQIEVVRYLLSLGAEPEPRDRWGNRPIDEARANGWTDIVALLSGEDPPPPSGPDETPPEESAPDAPERPGRGGRRERKGRRSNLEDVLKRPFPDS